MTWSTFRSIALTGLLGLAGVGAWSSATQKAPEPEGPFISCKGSPHQAILAIPSKVVSAWAQVACSKYGHVIVPAEGYLWSLYGGFAPIVFSAQEMSATKPPKEVGNTVYFLSINVERLSPEKAKALATEASWDKEAPKTVPSAYFVTATSSTGLSHRFWLLQYSDHISGAMPCPKEMQCDKADELMPFFIYDSKTKP
jgi:hypothetical protein